MKLSLLSVSTMALAALPSVSAFGGASVGAATGAGSDGVRHWHKLADGSLIMHNFECEPDTTCLYEGMTAPTTPSTDLAELQKISEQALASLQTTLSADDLAVMMEGARLAGYTDGAVFVPGRRLLDNKEEHSLYNGRRLMQSRGGGGEATYGGGGSSAYCPVGSYWGGAGTYCINNNIYWCQYPGTYTSDMRQNCGGRGCVMSAPGTPDQCDNSGNPNGSYCYNNNDCASHYCYYNRCSAPNNPNPNPPNGNINYNFWGPYYDSAVQGQNDRILDYIPNEYQCSLACMNERNFYCSSFEYAAASQKCVLSRGVAPVINTAWGWNLYIRK